MIRKDGEPGQHVLTVKPNYVLFAILTSEEVKQALAAAKAVL